MKETSNSSKQLSRKGGSELDPEIRQFLEIIASDAGHCPLPERMPFDEARRMLEHVRARWTRGGPEMAAIQDHELAADGTGFRIRIFRPQHGGALPALVYLHGGGWTYFSLKTHDRLMREYAARLRAIVVGVDYALSPEYRFPVALDQTLATIRWLRDQGPTLGIDPARIAAGGDSAGANLAVAASLAMRDEGEPNGLKALVLNYGAFDAEYSGESERRYGGDGYMLGAVEMRRFWGNYIRDRKDLEDPLVCPLRADLAGLPPSFLVIPECDLLAEQNHQMARKMREAGVPGTAVEYPGATHSFLEAMSIASVSRRALDDTASWLREQL